MKKRIYYHDTDCGGVVYYGNYLKYLEEARTELFEKAGLSVRDMADEGVVFVVARQETDYLIPAKYGDELGVEARIADISKASVTFDYDIRNQDGKTTTKAKTVMVCVGKDMKPRAIPDDIKEMILKIVK